MRPSVTSLSTSACRALSAASFFSLSLSEDLLPPRPRGLLGVTGSTKTSSSCAKAVCPCRSRKRISNECVLREMAVWSASPLTSHFCGQGKLVVALTMKGTPGSVTPKSEIVTAYEPEVDGFHTTRYVPSPLSRTFARA